MCFMAYAPEGVEFDAWHLLEASKLNPHGFGWSQGTDQSYRGMSASFAIGELLRARRNRLDVPAIYHARFATGDSPHTLANCQPLVLDDGTVLAHNGGLFPVTEWLEKQVSDTRIFATRYLPHFDLDSAADVLELQELIGPQNKMIIMRPGKETLILNRDKGIEMPDGSWYSNSDYTGVSHLRAEQCGACGTPVPGAGVASLCEDCLIDFENRRLALRARAFR